MAHSCCQTGFRWSGVPTGQETKINDLDVYVAGSNKDKAILFCHDAWGWTLNNNRLLCDHFAEEVGATVYLPDFYHGTAVPESAAETGLQNYDWPTWLSNNHSDLRFPEILTFAQHLKTQHPKLAVTGQCWGGRIALLLGSKQNSGLVDCVSIAHPSFISEDDLRGINVPLQILAPEFDPAYTPELKKFSNEFIPTIGIDYDYQYFPGVAHGFSTRCNDQDAKEKKALERAKNAVVYWFSNYLV